jgi:hypothetical protein
MLRSCVQWHRERWCLPGDAANVNDSLWIRRGDLPGLAALWWVQPTGDSDLSCADGVGDVDIERGIVTDTFGSV